MGIEKKFVAVCSGCGAEFEETFDTEEELKKAAIEDGWSEDCDQCPDCIEANSDEEDSE